MLSAQIESRVKIYNFNLLKMLINHLSHQVARMYFHEDPEIYLDWEILLVKDVASLQRCNRLITRHLIIIPT